MIVKCRLPNGVNSSIENIQFTSNKNLTVDEKKTLKLADFDYLWFIHNKEKKNSPQKLIFLLLI